MRIGVLAVLGLVGACVPIEGEQTSPVREGVLTELPEDVAAAADPKLLASTYRIDPVDNCFLFEYRGPVETTYLPLRTPDGRPICRPAPVEEVEGA